MEPLTKESGGITSSMVRDRNDGMTESCTQAPSSTVGKRVKASSASLMDLSMRAASLTNYLRVKASSAGTTVAHTMASGKKAPCTVKGPSPGPTKGPTKVTSSTTCETAMVFSSGLMAVLTRGIGGPRSKKASASTRIPMAKRSTGGGKQAKTQNGYLSKNLRRLWLL